MKKKISYIKDEGANLNVLITVLKSIVNCEAYVSIKSICNIFVKMYYLT